MKFFRFLFVAILLVATVLNGTDIEDSFKKGRLLAFDGKTDEAVKLLSEVLKQDPKFLKAHCEYQNARWLRDREGLVKEYAKRAKDNPQDPDSLYLHGNLFWRSGKLEEAKRLFDQCLKLQPKHRLARMAIARFYMMRKELDETERIVNELCNEDPNDLVSLRGKEIVALAKQNKQVAIQCVEKILTIPTEDPNEQLLVCNDLMIEKPEQARVCLKIILEKHPEAPSALLLEAKFLGIEEKYREAEELLKKAIKIEPNFADLHKTLAIIYKKTGQDDLAKLETETYQRLSEPEVGIVVSQEPKGEKGIGPKMD